MTSWMAFYARLARPLRSDASWTFARGKLTSIGEFVELVRSEIGGGPKPVFEPNPARAEEVSMWSQKPRFSCTKIGWAAATRAQRRGAAHRGLASAASLISTSRRSPPIGFSATRSPRRGPGLKDWRGGRCSPRAMSRIRCPLLDLVQGDRAGVREPTRARMAPGIGHAWSSRAPSRMA